LADWFLFPFPLALCAKRISADLRAKREKIKSAGAEKKERPPERAAFLKEL
jgi:hypothetical protein